MSKQTSIHYYIKIWLRNRAEPLNFPVGEAAWLRFKRSFETKKEGFFIFATQDGQTLALNLKFVKLAQVWQETGGKGQIERADDQKIKLVFQDSETVSFGAKDPVEWANIFAVLKPSRGGEVFSFADSEDKLVLTNIDELMLLAAPTAFVEEGFKQIYLRERGTLPPS